MKLWGEDLTSSTAELPPSFGVILKFPFHPMKVWGEDFPSLTNGLPPSFGITLKFLPHETLFGVKTSPPFLLDFYPLLGLL